MNVASPILSYPRKEEEEEVVEGEGGAREEEEQQKKPTCTCMCTGLSFTTCDMLRSSEIVIVKLCPKGVLW
jgi:hypothetical protein